MAVLAKLPYRAPAHAPAVASLLTSALAHPDAAVQTRAAKGLAELLAVKKPLLSAAETAVALATLASQAELLGATARTTLAPWLAAPRAAATEPGAYAPLGHFVPDISPTTAIAPVVAWHDLLFLTGQVLHHDDPAALERWLDGLLRLHGQLPAGHTLALRPYLQQHWPQLKGQSEAAQVAALEAIEPTTGHRGLTQALLLSWVRAFNTPLVPTVPLHDAYHIADPLVAVAQQRLACAEALLRTRTALPLLSTPSHAPYWVAPTVLVQRLLAYEAAAHVPHPGDLAVALARLAHAHASEAAAALALLPQLRHPGLRTLLGWLLGPADQALPALVASLVTPPRAASHLPTATVEDALPALWAAAARTKQPAGTFPELAGLTPGSIPGAAEPWQPNWEAVPLTRTYNDTWLAGNPEVTEHWTELRIALPTTTDAVSPLLLYALHATVPGRRSYEWTRYVYWLTADYPFLASLLPNSLAALHWHTLRVAAYTPSDLIGAALTSLHAGPGPRFDEAATLLLALGLTHETDYCRALAVEVLLAAITASRLAPTALGTSVGRLLAANFLVAKPFATSLGHTQASSPVVDTVLAHVLAALVPELPVTPPRLTRRLLEVYADLLARTHQPLPPAVRPKLLAWQKTANLKAVAKALLALSTPVHHLA